MNLMQQCMICDELDNFVQCSLQLCAVSISLSVISLYYAGCREATGLSLHSTIIIRSHFLLHFRGHVPMQFLRVAVPFSSSYLSSISRQVRPQARMLQQRARQGRCSSIKINPQQVGLQIEDECREKERHCKWESGWRRKAEFRY